MSDESKRIEEADSDLDALVDVIEAGKGRCEVPHDVALAVEPRCPACSYDCMELPTLIENGGWFCQRRTHVYMVVAQDWLGAIAEVREDRQQKRQETQERAEYAAALRRAEAERDELRAQAWGLICAGSNMAERKQHFRGLWATALEAGLKLERSVSDLTATRDLLNGENARLQARVATLELLRRGGK